jgi:hypothetical protein
MTTFTPGNKSYAKRMINYNAVYNKLNANSLNYNLQPNSKCGGCIGEIHNKNINGSDSPSSRLSYNTRISQIITTSLGGKTQYGNFYLGNPLNINCFGRVEGMPGGFGSPPINKFN